MDKIFKVGIVGAGIQGVSNALFLQKKGFDVTLFDRDEPGSPAASYGNAGHFSPYASLSLNRTDVLADVMKGDLIKVRIDSRDLIGIVVGVDENSMELQTPDGEIRWVSRYVIYEKIQ